MGDKGLKIAATLSLPLDAITETFAILAKRGKGKTYAASVMAEEMIGAGLPVCIIDPLGVWWGLRSSADGKGPGLPVVIFGGEHADVPINDSAGELVADVVIDERVPIILDLSLLSKAAMRRFMTAFLNRLYHRNRDPLHIFVDEADLFAPQRTSPEGTSLLGAMEDIQRRGRARGLGTTLITQRPAVLNKDVLTQAECLVVLGMTGPRDIAAIDEWVKLHGDEDEARKVKGSLAGLTVGQAWVWSPAWLDILERVTIRKRHTFDSSATPKPGVRRPTASDFAAVDLAAISARVVAIEEQHKADDPKLLRARIRELEKQLAVKPVVPEPVRVEVPVLTDEEGTLIAGALDALREVGTLMEKVLGVVTAPLPAPVRVTPVRVSPQPQTSVKRAHTVPVGSDTTDGSVPPAKLKLLHALVSLESIGVEAAPRTQVALFAGVSPKSGGYANNLGAMNTSGLITYPSKGLVQITDAGRAHVAEVPSAATTAELHDKVRGVLPAARWRIMEPLLDAYPQALSREELADLAGVSAASGGYANNLGALRSLGLLDYPTRGYVAASDLLFI